MKSRMPKVKLFQRWVYETIRTIRETGSYTLPQEVPTNNPMEMVSKVVKHKTEKKEIKKTLEKLKISIESSLERIESETEKTLNKIKDNDDDFCF